MNIKIAFNQLKNIKFSRTMCFFTGALVPIYADMLFINGFDSSTVSAIMDTIMAAAAGYTAIKVGKWLDSKLNDKAFEEANYFLTSLIDARTRASEITGSIQKIYNHIGSKDRNQIDNKYNILRKSTKELLADYEINLTQLNSKLSLIRVWGLEVKPDKKEKLAEIINSSIIFLEKSEEMLDTLHNVDGKARKTSYEFKFISYNHHFFITQILPDMWFTSWKGLFQVARNNSSSDN
ncbi:hypothetical protein [Enterobacter asburiae]|uniref:hypothetical protein n=1 Tax=Enterobacter asburiae TaxID=61645 RepID=UPI0013D7B7C0|nr:hypothetical protein [Enterobacter asburiae]HCR0957094.1 hypothetical protein [Enterobacter asburiae]